MDPSLEKDMKKPGHAPGFFMPVFHGYRTRSAGTALRNQLAQSQPIMR